MVAGGWWPTAKEIVGDCRRNRVGALEAEPLRAWSAIKKRVFSVASFLLLFDR